MSIDACNQSIGTESWKSKFEALNFHLHFLLTYYISIIVILKTFQQFTMWHILKIALKERDERLLQWLLRCKLLNTILPNFRDFTILGDEQSCTP